MFTPPLTTLAGTIGFVQSRPVEVLEVVVVPPAPLPPVPPPAVPPVLVVPPVPLGRSPPEPPQLIVMLARATQPIAAVARKIVAACRIVSVLSPESVSKLPKS